jgi:FkbM family methyltransferase
MMLKSLYRRIFARPAFRGFNSRLFELSLSGLGILNCEDKVASGEEYFINRVLGEKIKRRHPIFFDVGANVGEYSASLAKRFPNASIYAIEPHPRNFERLSQRLGSHAGACLLNTAVGAEGGVIHLHDRADVDGSSHASVFREVISDLHGQEVCSYEVPIRTLDEIAQAESVDFIDLLKIDTEGNELAVLRGGEDLDRGAENSIHPLRV